MLDTLTLAGFGPHAQITVPLSGHIEAEGPSESGKTTIVRGIAFCLWGLELHGKKFHPAHIRTGETTLSAELRTLSGRAFHRTLDTKGRTTRTMDGQPITSERAFREALRDLGNDSVGRIILVPYAWKSLAAGNARALRDLLMNLFPVDATSVVEELLANAGFQASERAELLMDEKQVGTLRRNARKERDILTGRVASLQESHDLLQSLAPPDEPGSIDLAAWSAYHEARTTYEQAIEDRSRHEAAAIAWDYRKNELGEPPPKPILRPLEERAKRTAAALDQAKDAYRDANAALADAKKLLEAGEHCPTCGKDGFADSPATKRIAAVAQELEERRTQAIGSGKAAREAHAAAVAALEAGKEASNAVMRYQTGLSALGRRPRVPEPPAMPQRPQGPEPAAAELANANLAAERKADLKRTATQLTAAQKELAQASEDADRFHALLEAVRAAPSRLAAAQAEKLGDLGPVSLHFGDNPAVEVHIDGRPWWLASQGRQLVADACFRAALRRASGIELPLVLDNVQDVAGQPLPPLPAPTLSLRTADCGKLQLDRS